MGRFILLASSLLFFVLADTDNLIYGWPVLGLLFLAMDILWMPLLSLALGIQVFAWTATGQWLMSGILLVLWIFHQQSIKQQSLWIEPNGLTRSFPWKRHIPWKDIEFMLLKDGLLTIEYKNGRVFQQRIEKDLALNEADFNEFCHQQCQP